MKKAVVGILAHVDAGKTTLSESLLYESGVIRRLGRVDHRDTVLDNHPIERERGITVFSKMARLHWGDMDITLLDTPGHSDFSTEMERALQVLDYAVLVISGTDGVQAHTETLWSLLERYAIPTFVFITKMDVSALSPAHITNELHARLDEGCIDFTHTIGEELQEQLALLSDKALESYSTSGQVAEGELRSLLSARRLFPCVFGSGLKNDGVDAFLSLLERFIAQEKYPPAFGAKVFKVARDEQGNRLTYIKVTGGSLKVRSELRYAPLHGLEPLCEKISQIRLYSGARYESVESVEAGQVCALLGLSGTWPGQGLGIEQDAAAPLLEPVLGYRITLPKGVDARQALPKLRLLEEEDPQLHVVWEAESGEIRIQLMGAVQIGVLRELIHDRFDMDVQFDTGSILYRETIRGQVEGIGHYEPLKHYAEVHLLIEALPPGRGLEFATAVSSDDLALNWQRLILTHLEERQHKGVLTGSPLSDVRITLLSGRAHLKHTEGGDFRQATYRAVRQGLMRAESVLLEPYYAFRLEIPPENLGRALSDIRQMGGEHSSPDTFGERVIISGTAPVSTMAGYMTTLSAYTRGRGRLSCLPGGYRPCRNADSVVAERGYNPEKDLEHTPDSVFCAHGAGFTVKWDKVEEYMHLESALKAPKEEDGTVKTVRRTINTNIDERELEAIMLREFGPIRRSVYSAPTIRTAPETDRQTRRKETLIVDGYNVLFAWDELKDLVYEDIDLSRERLLEALVNYRAYTQNDVVLIFDAYRVSGGKGERSDVEGVRVAYTKEGESADMYIEALAGEIGRNQQVRVVTSDSLIRLSALRSGVLRCDSREFINELEAVQKQIRMHL